MQIVNSIADVRRLSATLRRHPASATLALVPTMGALHEGHLSLIRAARQACTHVAVSIFVNPTQFAPTEDLSQYPRTFQRDCELLEEEGVDLLFAPTSQEMYPHAMETWVDLPSIGARLDGASRPGHFRGVATVVAKLFNIVQPDKTFFGQKDAAQVAVLRTMVRDLNFDVEVVVCPTVRDKDGLALSSRNRFLDPGDRRSALALSRALHNAKQAIAEGRSEPSSLKQQLMHDMQATPHLRLDYAEVVHPLTLEELPDLENGALLAVAAWAGETRLIDNILIYPQTEPTK